ncbi:MAG: hypothetical protein CVU56_20875 [Deltaproteobacteria bacterium HGW-Deltaproteobacteria-14]|nr:MAG: hypothetical protein CVU56_20875 [Deltaproteobacteria bacterium HGW-Deltaproteobacteria-14]
MSGAVPHLPVKDDDGALIFGVCAGLGALLGIRAAWVRGAFLVLAAASGIGVVVYLVAAAVMPAPAEAGLPWPARLRERLSHLIAGAAGLTGRFSQLIDLWRERRGSSDPGAAARGAIAGIALVCGALLLFQSFGLLAWLTFARAIALLLLLIGFGLLHRR